MSFGVFVWLCFVEGEFGGTEWFVVVLREFFDVYVYGS